jgi:Ni/Co efflux regulator RcnB
MKKIITLLMAVALVATVSAQVQFDGRSIKNKRILSNEKVNSKAKSGFSKNRVHTKALGELITEQPECEAKQYVRSGFGFVVFDNTLFTTEQEGKTTIVYDED